MTEGKLLTLLSEKQRAGLEKISTATIATLLLKKGLRAQYIQGVYPLSKDSKKLIGPAFTLRYIPAREDISTVQSFANPKHPQRLAVEEVPEGYVLVMDCRQDSSAASLGSIIATRLMVRKCAGVVTDAGVRDAVEISKFDLPVFAACASAPTNLSKHQAIDMNLPIGCGGAPVYPGDIIVGDTDGVMVIPLNLVDEVIEEGLKMEDFEVFATAEVRAGRPIIGTYPPNEETRQRYELYKCGKYHPSPVK